MDRLCPRTGDGKAPAAELTLGQVLRTFLSSVIEVLHLGARPLQVLRRLAACGTFELGAHLYECEGCHKQHWAPCSCGERHCPGCLAGKSHHWLLKQMASLLPVIYYHGVFTLPPQLHGLVQLNPARLYPLLFDAASQALLEFGRNRLGGELGITAVLHTWGQQLNVHPHLHCIIPGGALSADGSRWREPKQRKFLFPVRALAALFRGKFLSGLQRLLDDTDKPLRLPDASWQDPIQRARQISGLYAQRWHLYVQRPFGGPQQVLAYLAHYTHRVALSNRRLVGLDPVRRTVTFTYRDYRHGSSVKLLTLSAPEFIRRFSWHILPPGLVRIRHYGILGNNRRHRDIPRARASIQKQARRRRQAVKTAILPRPASPSRCCPHCGSNQTALAGLDGPVGPPAFPPGCSVGFVMKSNCRHQFHRAMRRPKTVGVDAQAACCLQFGPPPGEWTQSPRKSGWAEAGNLPDCTPRTVPASGLTARSRLDEATPPVRRVTFPFLRLRGLRPTVE